MLRRVARYKCRDVSDELAVSILKVERGGRTLKIEALFCVIDSTHKKLTKCAR
jgi:hypothetical protein